ncbi:beta-propeller domain-containing protein, partial [Candidatus Woesearchaeota archaeon]|nr:beta-propeller domain-containing protein [Candidatus Woesearchaeota archaeon]
MIQMKKHKTIIGLCILMILTAGVLLASCTTPPSSVNGGSKTPKDSQGKKLVELEATQELKKFSSAQEIKEFLKNSAANQGYGGIYSKAARGMGSDVMMAVTESAAPQTAAAKSAESSAGASQYSKTNIQVEGVDEADFVKNDDKYIYIISQDKMVIVDAYPAEKAEILSKTKIDGRPRDMYVNKDRLVVFADDNDEVYALSEYDFIPRPRQTAATHVYIYDISDRKNPKLAKDYSIKGNYFQSRMIGDYVYFIAREWVYYYGNFVDLPIVKSASRTITRPDIYYFDNPEDSYSFNTVASFNIFDDKDKVNAKTFMMGQSNNLYVSQNNIYITYQKNLPYRYYRVHNEERFFDVVVPLLPSEPQDKIKEIKSDNGLNSYEKWDKISSILEETYNKMDKDEKEKLFDKIENAIEEYEAKLEAERRKTVIHKIKIDKGDIEYQSKGEVPGYLLNQFSMDENGEYFRVATTTEIYGRKRFEMYNNVFVLDKKLNVVGKLEDIAPDERIYSTRFIGNRLYMVTFKRIDPLFVIDLSNPEKPKILGELKIPGFSDYLHPYDENHIIGVGKETGSNEWGGVSTKGVKLALFDVSDISKPKELDKYEIGEAGTDSEALRDHK